jgi:CDP-diacylglycerol--glycerol-3-phosphate 3-phosphatidyltransferase
MNLPTKFTILRILLTFLTMALLFVPGWPAKASALGCFGLASLTDWLDGTLARRWDQQTALGALLDPIADKIMVLGLLLAFIQLRLVPAWMVLLIMSRELLITGVRLVAASRGVVLAAANEGKHKTVSQMVAIVVILAVLLLREAVAPDRLAWRVDQALHQLIIGCLWVTMLLTLISGVSFFWRHRSVLRDAL